MIDVKALMLANEVRYRRYKIGRMSFGRVIPPAVMLAIYRTFLFREQFYCGHQACLRNNCSCYTHSSTVDHCSDRVSGHVTSITSYTHSSVIFGAAKPLIEFRPVIQQRLSSTDVASEYRRERYPILFTIQSKWRILSR